MSTPIDAAAALALTADLYRQLTDTRQQVAELRTALAHEQQARAEDRQRYEASLREALGDDATVLDEAPEPPT